MRLFLDNLKSADIHMPTDFSCRYLVYIHMPARYSNELTKNKTITFVNQYKSCAKLVIVILISNYFEIKLANLRNYSYLCPVIAN